MHIRVYMSSFLWRIAADQPQARGHAGRGTPRIYGTNQADHTFPSSVWSRTSITKSLSPKILSSPLIRSWLFDRIFLTSFQPPRLLIKPPPTNSGLRPSEAPVFTKAKYAFPAFFTVFPKCANTYPVSCHSRGLSPSKALCPE